jgi:hypothetical protein
MDSRTVPINTLTGEIGAPFPKLDGANKAGGTFIDPAGRLSTDPGDLGEQANGVESPEQSEQANRTIPARIVAFLARQSRGVRIGEIADYLSTELRREVSRDAIRVHLVGLVDRLKVNRIGYGVYAARGLVLARYNLLPWAEDRMRLDWPAAHDAASLRKAYKIECGREVPLRTIAECFRSMAGRGMVRETRLGWWTWAESRTMDDLLA